MDFSDKELKVLLQALYRFRGEVSGGSQSEQNKLGLVSSIIDKIEVKTGPARAEHTLFDEEMAKSLSVLATGRTSSSKAGSELDKGDSSPKVKKASPARAASAKSPAKSPAISSAAGKRVGAASKAPKARSAKTTGPKKAGSGKTKS
jgi:hypothetical protein